MVREILFCLEKGELYTLLVLIGQRRKNMIKRYRIYVVTKRYFSYLHLVSALETFLIHQA